MDFVAKVTLFCRSAASLRNLQSVYNASAPLIHNFVIADGY